MKNKQIRKVYRLSDIVILGGTLISGLLFTFVFPSLNWLGISILVIAIFLPPFCKTGYRIESQDGVFLKKDYVLPGECKNQIAEFMEGKSEALNINPFKKGGLLLELYYKKDRSRQFGQIFDYDGFVYTAQSALSELDDEHLREILKYQS
ncbi:MAG: hypothetical protein KBS72_01545 [Bacteroidales bacterium]|nr:hypothetical protein [Candidatus Cacconaster scatequi]